MNRSKASCVRVSILAGVLAAVAATPAFAVIPQLPNPLTAPSALTWVTSDRCIQLEEQFDAAAGQQAGNPNLALAQSHREKGAYLCNNDADDIGERELEKALRLIGVEPDPVP